MNNLNIKKYGYNIKVKTAICKNSILKNYMDFDYFTGLCKNGCSNYNSNHTCPPNSPKFIDYTKDYEYSLIVLMYTEMNKYDSIENVHKLLRKVLSELLIPLEKEFNGLLTEGGRCLYCKECTYIKNLPCRYPTKMRFSMESMGIDLNRVSKDILNHTIRWNKGYCTVIGSVNFKHI